MYSFAPESSYKGQQWLIKARNQAKLFNQYQEQKKTGGEKLHMQNWCMQRETYVGVLSYQMNKNE